MKEQPPYYVITDEIIKDAYSRLKSFVYYDNFNLALRIKLAKFESEGHVAQKLSQLQQELNEYLQGSKLNSRITQLITKIGYFSVPKSFENDSNSHKINGILISNTGANNHNQFTLRKNTILIDCDIELHLIATLWIVLEGVRLVNKIGKDSYGYHIQLREGTTEIDGQKRLFSKYFDKYQEWRDKGIRSAKKQIEDGNDILLLSLDIKNFFHSVQVDFTQLKQDVHCSEQNSLTSIIEKICFKHTQIVNEVNGDKHPLKRPLLPIGFVSSGVIANWLLSDFDKSIKDKMAPVYYGRYVDDIFIVISNVKPNFSKAKQDEDNVEEISKWIRNRFFHDDAPLRLKSIKHDNGGGQSHIFELNENMCNGLTIQPKKLKLFYFSPDWPLAMLNKFEKTLEENSSAFWFLPDEEKMEDSLDDKAYDMHYEDTINKFRSVSDVKASKYGASVFLAKRIKLSTLNLNSLDEKLTKEVFRFFNGIATLSLYNMWEKVFTYLVATKDIRSIKKLHKNIRQAIDNISYNKGDVKKVKEDLYKYLETCLSLAFSHYPSLYNKLSKTDKSFEEKLYKIKENIKFLRKSLLTRHHYLPFPPIVLTQYYTEKETDLIGDVNLLEILFNNDNKLQLDESLQIENWRVPRWIHLQEICLLEIANLVREHANNSKKMLLHTSIGAEKDKKIKEKYTETCVNLYNTTNGTQLYNLVTTEEHKRYSDKYDSKKNYRIAADVVNIKDDANNEDLTLTIGVSNVKVHLSDITKAINTKSVLSKKKRETHIKLLNEATSEKLDLLLLPETFVPFEWLFAYADEGRRKQRAFIFGLEHFTVNNYCYNLATTILPINSGKIKECFIVPRLKNHYSPHEIDEIESIGKKVPLNTPSTYHLFKWRGLQFTLYNCYELTNVVHRSIFGADLDMLFAVEYNKDVNYFSNIAESTCRDLHCYYIQANTSDYGDSRIIQPTESVLMNPVRVKGGENNVILKYKLDIKKLRLFQNKRMPYQRNDRSFKSTPPDYDHEKVNKRGK